MRIHCLQHVPFETPAAIGDWARLRGHALDTTLMHDAVALPALAGIDMLVLMGGPMSVHDAAQLDWLAQEKRYLAQALAQGKRVLGICLGAQLVAEALGGQVTRNREREIGWFPLIRVAGLDDAHAALLPPRLDAFHWHGETFSLPAGATRLAASQACTNQVFCVGDRVLGLQCHLETTPDGVQALIEHCPEDLQPGAWVQDAATMLASPARFAAAHAALFDLLDRFFPSR